MAAPGWNLRRYVGYGWDIVRTNTIVLWWVGFVGLLSGIALFMKGSSWFWPLNLAVTILSILSTPVIYGLYYELIEDAYSSIPQIARKYIPGYVWLIIRMYLPPIFLASMLVTAAAGPAAGGGVMEITLIGFSLLYLFVIPFFYLAGTGTGAIVRGVSYLGRNLSSATPILLAVLLLESTMLVVQYQRANFSADPSPLFVAIDFLVYVCASIADYIIFMTLIFVLKDHPPAPDPVDVS